jgi:Ser/Thr protein kinase RdoA (MazF antagonist)
VTEPPPELHALLRDLERDGLGAATAAPTRCRGGAVHQVWHVPTDRGAYAVKLLDGLALADEARQGDVRQGEDVARRAESQGVPAVLALPARDGDVVWAAGAAGALVYPWAAAAPSAAPPRRQRARTIATILRTLHGAQLSAPDPRLRPWRLPDPLDWEALVAQAADRGMSWAADLARSLETIDDWSGRYAALPADRPAVVAHGDIVPTNVVWTSEGPRIVDWEFAGPVDRDADVVTTAIAWSSTRGGIDAAAFRAFWETFQPGRVDLDVAFAIRAARIVAWVAFDIRRWLTGGGRPRHLLPALWELGSLHQMQRDVAELIATTA